MIDQFTPRYLTTAINEIKAPKTLLYDLVFRRRETSPAEIVDFEIISGGQGLAKFVARGREAIVTQKKGRTVYTFRIPSIREKSLFKAADFLSKTAPGTALYQTAGDLQKAAQQAVLSQLAEYKNTHLRTKEWMCAQALSGTLTITKDDGDLSIDYGLATAHKPVLTAGEKWDASADVDIPGHLRAWNRLIGKDSGTTGSIVVMGTNAVDLFLKNNPVLKLLDNKNVSAGKLELDGGSKYLGSFSGFGFYEYNEIYKDDAGTEHDMVDPDAVIMVSDSDAFKFWHGPVDDLDANFGTHEFFSKSYRQQDPSQDTLLVATAPVPMIHNPGAVIYATVA